MKATIQCLTGSPEKSPGFYWIRSRFDRLTMSDQDRLTPFILSLLLPLILSLVLPLILNLMTPLILSLSKDEYIIKGN